MKFVDWCWGIIPDSASFDHHEGCWWFHPLVASIASHFCHPSMRWNHAHQLVTLQDLIGIHGVRYWNLKLLHEEYQRRCSAAGNLQPMYLKMIEKMTHSSCTSSSLGELVLRNKIQTKVPSYSSLAPHLFHCLNWGNKWPSPPFVFLQTSPSFFKNWNQPLEWSSSVVVKFNREVPQNNKNNIWNW